ncbi:DUF2750 domain-containing protein [uncultured Flavobacterium sp.]|uniref:DUF2750 domain-containing protein n=1 Tax=uncultured Flavobacterium sp. TaxID=165435 RepID=UPI0012265184|nr:DUF2750 domain-containing protein [uncultured Flavobacterium sp.]THD32500.1 MAG: DUF2750 domain-containing protein [Flavobacterium johnsoniae]
MIQDVLELQQRHEDFIKNICQTEIVFGLENNVGFATLDSTNYENENGKSMPVMCFWSDRNKALACAKDKWKQYRTAEIKLSEFIEEWCVGMYNEGLLAGTDFDENKQGNESDALELLLEITAELESLGKEPEFKKFENLADLEEQIREILE